MKKIVFATNNSHKLEELRTILGDKIEILSLKEINCFDDIEEYETTFAGNALIKAKYIKEKYGFDCFADDSGLEISALNNEPGVYSARYAGEDCDSEKNIQKVLLNMANVSDCSARFKTVFALIIGDEISYFEGTVEGEILKEKMGNEGFGYDPIFKPYCSDKSFAQMSNEEKNRISHRGIASQKLLKYLLKI